MEELTRDVLFERIDDRAFNIANEKLTNISRMELKGNDRNVTKFWVLFCPETWQFEWCKRFSINVKCNDLT